MAVIRPAHWEADHWAGLCLDGNQDLQRRGCDVESSDSDSDSDSLPFPGPDSSKHR